MTPKTDDWDDLLSLASISDAEIQLDDIPETSNFAHSRRGAFDPLQRRDHDVRAIANWFIDKAQLAKLSIAKVWVNKLTYLAYETAILDENIVLTPARAEAWNFGPVFREIYSQFDEIESRGHLEKFSIVGRQRIKVESRFDACETQILEQVWEKYSTMSATDLTAVTHAEGTPWRTVWELGGEVNPGMAIDPALILGRNRGQFDGKH